MIKKLILVLCTLFVIPLCASADTTDVDYKSYCTYEDVKVIKNTNDTNWCVSYTLESSNGEKLSYEFYPTTLFRKTSDCVSLRKSPTTLYDRVAVVDAGTGLLELGKCEEGWSLIWLNNNYYFVWSEYLVDIDDDTKLRLNITFEKESVWTYIGNCRISSYCYNCNTPNYSRISGVSGWKCEEWNTCAMNGIPFGTKIYVEDYGYFYVNDTGPSAMNGGKWVDLFVDSNSCHIWTHKRVWIVE